MNKRSLTIEASLDGLRINSIELSRTSQLSAYLGAIGEPSRSWEGPVPAPYGFRNNIRHIYDDIGIYLIEHHSAQNILSVTIITDKSRISNTTEIPTVEYNGELLVSGVKVSRKTSLRTFLEESKDSYERVFPGEWKAKSEICYLNVSCERQIGSSESMDERIARIDCCF